MEMNRNVDIFRSSVLVILYTSYVDSINKLKFDLYKGNEVKIFV